MMTSSLTNYTPHLFNAFFVRRRNLFLVFIGMKKLAMVLGKTGYALCWLFATSNVCSCFVTVPIEYGLHCGRGGGDCWSDTRSRRTVQRSLDQNRQTSRRTIFSLIQSTADSQDATSINTDPSYDVVVIGSGIGGLSAAAMLCHYGYKVAVFESHYSTGGAAHGFSIRDKDVGTFVFDTGPSFFSGLNPDIPPKASNPLRTILDTIDESVECVPYTSFGLRFPEGDFVHTPSFGSQEGVLGKISGTKGVQQWNDVMTSMKPLEAAVAALPTAALRFDAGALLTTTPFLPKFSNTGNPFASFKLTTPFQSVLDDSGLSDKFAQNWLDLLCFCLSGLPASGTITAEMAMMMGEFYDKDAVMDCPVGGARGIVNALVRGIEKKGGSIFLNSHVEEVMLDNGRATGVKLKGRGGNGGVAVKAKKAVISNMSVWDLYGSHMIPEGAISSSARQEKLSTPVGKSFMHLHVGFRASKDELAKLEAHYMCIEDWDIGVEAEDNAVLLSIPSVHDDTLAPPGYAVLHIYTPATEEFERWKGMKRNTTEYDLLKEDRSQYLWKVLETIIPDIRERTQLSRVGTPLTHKRFLRRHNGSYGPAIEAGKGSFPFPSTKMKGLLVCGDSCFPGIGVPAVAGSGLLAANSVSLDSLKPQLELLRKMR
jgi:phytoene dehydrogenase-like protein